MVASKPYLTKLTGFFRLFFNSIAILGGVCELDAGTKEEYNAGLEFSPMVSAFYKDL